MGILLYLIRGNPEGALCGILCIDPSVLIFSFLVNFTLICRIDVVLDYINIWYWPETFVTWGACCPFCWFHDVSPTSHCSSCWAQAQIQLSCASLGRTQSTEGCTNGVEMSVCAQTCFGAWFSFSELHQVSLPVTPGSVSAGENPFTQVGAVLWNKTNTRVHKCCKRNLVPAQHTLSIWIQSPLKPWCRSEG